MEPEKINQKSEAAIREERVLAFWKENKTFQKSLEQSEGGTEFIFYDGPVTANSKPVLHTMVPFSFKDVIPRYKTMRGYHVRRKGGWDTHGLPVELQVEKKLGLNSKKAIEEYGIAEFNQRCKESVWEYVGFWKNFTNRMGYWADQENAYVTYDNTYIESVWNVVKKINEQGLLYKDYRIVPWCPRCGTALSSHELAQGYEVVKDLSVTAKFKVVGQENTYILAWTTTPWTLPGNVALAVGRDIEYIKVKSGNEFYILAKERVSMLTEPYEVVEELQGKDLIGLEYEPLYPYLADTISEKEKPKLEKAFKIYRADFVTTTEGTGVVHTAVMYGQDDFVLGTRIGLPKHHLVGLDGKFLPGTGPFEGRFVKDEEVAVDIIKDLAHRGLLFKKEKYEHSYPHCWRCHTALIYYARDSWYIKMSDPKIKAELISQNKEINWEPTHIRDGRFGEWLREIKDWAVSRERYWGTPLPVWQCVACKKFDVVGSIAYLKEKTKKSGNRYFVMRHGEAENNVLNILSSDIHTQHHLTENGKNQIRESVQKIKNINFDYIFTSPIIRAEETLKLVRDELKISAPIQIENRLWEVKTGILDGKNMEEYRAWIGDSRLVQFTKVPEGGESLNDVRRRVGEFLYELENKYSDKNILIVSHGDPIWIMRSLTEGMTPPEAIKTCADNYPKNGEIFELDFVPLPHNENYELDLHRPYIDEVKLSCSCGGDLVRGKEVMDVWFDSGCVPFAQDHYPFENKEWVEGKGYPADFISEAIDQTRGWFYTLHAVGILMGRGKAYKNVICLGHLLDANGKKMSKSVGNVVDPWVVMDKYGVDTLRLWMYSVNQPGESKNFDEKTVALLHQQVFGLLYNILAFYELYRDKNLETNARTRSKNILDKWILERLDELTDLMTENLDNYKLLEPTRAMRDFIGDLSTWYLRRSRDRIKGGDIEAKQTLYFVLKTLAKLMAPLAPFAADDIWLKLQNENDVESVHLSAWPRKAFNILFFLKSRIIENMAVARKVVSLGLEARQKARILTRQSLAGLHIDYPESDIDYPRFLSEELLNIIMEEINVKKITFKKVKDLEVVNAKLDTEVTGELKQEGDYRELVRALQDMRKKMGLTPSEAVSISFETDERGQKLIEKFEADLKKTVLVSKIEFKNNDGEEVRIYSLVFKVKIDKI